MGFDDDDPPFLHRKNKYDLNSKIMITAIISLSIVVFFVTLLHIYARYVLRRQARRRAELQRVNIIVSSALQVEPPKTGLDPSVITSIPLFIYKKNNDVQNSSIECTVCLSVIENGETVRTLPNCKHIFHAECIDKWFGSHSTCPICRTEAEPRLLLPEPREGPTTTPSAPPIIEGGNSVNVEGIICSDCGLTQTSTSSSDKISGSSSRLSSFRRMISREKSSRRLQVQFCGVENGVNDLERQ